METVFTIQQVVQQTGLSIDTLRYYERIKLIEPVRRTANDHRQYRQTDLDWIHLIMRLRETGMPLAQISYFAQLRRQAADDYRTASHSGESPAPFRTAAAAPGATYGGVDRRN